MVIDFTYKIGRVYQHQDGNAWAAVIVKVADDFINVSVPLHSIEKNLQRYLKDYFSSKELMNKEFTGKFEI